MGHHSGHDGAFAVAVSGHFPRRAPARRGTRFGEQRNQEIGHLIVLTTPTTCWPCCSGNKAVTQRKVLSSERCASHTHTMLLFFSLSFLRHRHAFNTLPTKVLLRKFPLNKYPCQSPHHAFPTLCAMYLNDVYMGQGSEYLIGDDDKVMSLALVLLGNTEIRNVDFGHTLNHRGWWQSTNDKVIDWPVKSYLFQRLRSLLQLCTSCHSQNISLVRWTCS